MTGSSYGRPSAEEDRVEQPSPPQSEPRTIPTSNGEQSDLMRPLDIDSTYQSALEGMSALREAAATPFSVCNVHEDNNEKNSPNSGALDAQCHNVASACRNGVASKDAVAGLLTQPEKEVGRAVSKVLHPASDRGTSPAAAVASTEHRPDAEGQSRRDAQAIARESLGKAQDAAAGGQQALLNFTSSPPSVRASSQGAPQSPDLRGELEVTVGPPSPFEDKDGTMELLSFAADHPVLRRVFQALQTEWTPLYESLRQRALTAATGKEADTCEAIIKEVRSACNYLHNGVISLDCLDLASIDEAEFGSRSAVRQTRKELISVLEALASRLEQLSDYLTSLLPKFPKSPLPSSSVTSDVAVADISQKDDEWDARARLVLAQQQERQLKEGLTKDSDGRKRHREYVRGPCDREITSGHRNSSPKRHQSTKENDDVDDSRFDVDAQVQGSRWTANRRSHSPSARFGMSEVLKATSGSSSAAQSQKGFRGVQSSFSAAPVRYTKEQQEHSTSQTPSNYSRGDHFRERAFSTSYTQDPRESLKRPSSNWSSRPAPDAHDGSHISSGVEGAVKVGGNRGEPRNSLRVDEGGVSAVGGGARAKHNEAPSSSTSASLSSNSGRHKGGASTATEHTSNNYASDAKSSTLPDGASSGAPAGRGLRGRGRGRGEGGLGRGRGNGVSSLSPHTIPSMSSHSTSSPLPVSTERIAGGDEEADDEDDFRDDKQRHVEGDEGEGDNDAPSRKRKKTRQPVDWLERVSDKIDRFKLHTSQGGCATSLYERPVTRDTMLELLGKCESYLAPSDEALLTPLQLKMVIETFIAALDAAKGYLQQLRVNKTQLRLLYQSSRVLDDLADPHDLLPEIRSLKALLQTFGLF